MRYSNSWQHIAITLHILMLLPISFAWAETRESGKFYGAKITEYPEWFKQSFLNLPDDIEEATSSGKRIVLFFYQQGCPYCNALVERNLAQKDIATKIKQHFDIIALNMWGDREVTYVNNQQFIEKELALALKVQFTPTLLFFDEKGKVILRLNGYRSPSKFNVDLDYVALHKENELSYLDYVKANLPEKMANKTMHAEDFFSASPYNLYADAGNKPIAIFFEQKDCPDCDTLHSKVLPDKELRTLIKGFKSVQLDMWSSTPITTPAGVVTTAREWAKQLDVKFAPSIVLFNAQGQEIIRSEGMFKVFHTQGIFDYVLSNAYQKQPSFQRYLSSRSEAIREKGGDVDIWRYANEPAATNH